MPCIIDAMDDLPHGSRTLFRNCDESFCHNLLGAIGIPMIFNEDDLAQKGRPLAELIQLHGDKLCSEPRDAIFALQGIADVNYITPDYSRSISDVYTSTVKAIIKYEGNYNIICSDVDDRLSEAQGVPPFLDDLPSWVPHFESVLATEKLHSYLLDYNDQYYSVGGPTPAEFDSDSDFGDGVLRISGCFYGSIYETKPKFDYYDKGGDDSLWEDFEALKPTSRTIDELDFWRSMVLNLYPNSEGRDNRAEPGSKPFKMLSSDLNKARLQRPPFRLLKRLEVTLDGKIVCLTSHGNIAVAIGQARVGDLIYVVRGATNPFIPPPASLAKISGIVGSASPNPKFYEFVGGAYIHGIMDGEVLSMIGKKNKSLDQGSVLQEEVICLI